MKKLDAKRQSVGLKRQFLRMMRGKVALCLRSRGKNVRDIVNDGVLGVGLRCTRAARIAGVSASFLRRFRFNRSDAVLWPPECRRARDTFWDIPVPKMTALGDSLWAPVRPASVALRRHHRKLDAGFAPLPQMA